MEFEVTNEAQREQGDCVVDALRLRRERAEDAARRKKRLQSAQARREARQEARAQASSKWRASYQHCQFLLARRAPTDRAPN